MITAVVTDQGQAVMTSLAAALAMFLAAIPRVIGFLVIGWLIASVLAGVTANMLRAMRFNDLAQRSGFSGFVQSTGVRTDASTFIAEVVRWFVRLIVLVVAFDALGLPAVSQVLEQLLLWLPNLVVALVVLVLGGLAANWLHGLVRGATAEAGLGTPDFLAGVARVAVWSFAAIVAVNQLGVATTLVNTLFTGLVGALALALGLAFGLGGRDTAAEVVLGWYLGWRQAAPQVQQAAARAQQEVQEDTTEAWRESRMRAT